MDKEIIKALYEPFELKERKGVGNQTFKYVSSEDIVDRMNKTFKGNWTTEVTSDKIIEDHILICVKVCVKDPESGQLFCHEGYASHMLAKYTGGPNQGKIVDIGNSYKSAMSKAIKTAVARWGVGLYLETEEDSDSHISGIVSIPHVNTPQEFSAGAPTPSKLNNSPPISGPPITAKASNVPPIAGPPLNTSVSAGPPITAPPINPGPSVDASYSKTQINQPPIFTVENVAPKKTSSTFDIPSGGAIEKITDVQRVAIETLMGMHSISFEELRTKALKRQDNLPPTIDVVTYLDAVTMIQYGNDLRQM